MSHNVSQFLVRAETSHLTKTVPRLAVNANLALLVGLVMVSLDPSPAFHAFDGFGRDETLTVGT